jgi:hypothetical protein
MSEPVTVTYDVIGRPKTTVTSSDLFFEAVIEVDGLDAQRDTTAEERALGVRSLTPPRVIVRKRRAAKDSHRALITAAQRAVVGAATSTTGENGGPSGLLFTHVRVAMAIRAALRMLKEDI